MSVCLHQNNIKTTEPFGPNVFAATHMTQLHLWIKLKGVDWQKYWHLLFSSVFDGGEVVYRTWQIRCIEFGECNVSDSTDFTNLNFHPYMIIRFFGYDASELADMFCRYTASELADMMHWNWQWRIWWIRFIGSWCKFLDIPVISTIFKILEISVFAELSAFISFRIIFIIISRQPIIS